MTSKTYDYEQEDAEAKLIVRELLDQPFEDRFDQLALSTGLVVQESAVVHYLSITVRSTCIQEQKWRQRDVFDI